MIFSKRDTASNVSVAINVATTENIEVTNKAFSLSPLQYHYCDYYQSD
jgi:hypothetical protein